MNLKRLKLLLQRPFGPRDQGDRGMTIIEILIVIALIGTIMTVLVGKLLDKGDDARKSLATVAMSGAIKGGLDLYRLKSGRYPTTEEGLNALIEAPSTAKNWSGPYVENGQLNDPWGNPYRYESSSAKTFKITSVGPDGTEGTEDDVVYPPEAAGAQKPEGQ